MDDQARRDAMADAASLREAWKYTARPMLEVIIDAADEAGYGDAHFISSTVFCARAAFRAVPGLRG